MGGWAIMGLCVTVRVCVLAALFAVSADEMGKAGETWLGLI